MKYHTFLSDFSRENSFIGPFPKSSILEKLFHSIEIQIVIKWHIFCLKKIRSYIKGILRPSTSIWDPNNEWKYN
jgi:hypothetical protein